jgi:hypothetical protein
MKKTIVLIAMCLFYSTAFAKAKPDHLIIMVFDQMRPDFVDRFDLKNFKRLRKMGLNYPNAIVGHSASLTIVSHPVITTGLLPKDLPWSDDVYWDKNGVFGAKDAVTAPTRFNRDQILNALKTLDTEKMLPKILSDRLKRPVFSVGEKYYAGISFGGPTATSILTMNMEKSGECVPAGVNIPTYILSNDRYKVNCSETYGTEKSLYPLTGKQYYPGTDPKNLGGDIWTADAALDIMKHEDWGALLLTFGAVDKFAHMLGDEDRVKPVSFSSPMTTAEAARVADEQLGRILDELKKQKLLERTMIVATADHGGQSNFYYFGDGSTGSISAEAAKKSPPNSYWMRKIHAAGKIRLTAADTGMRVWLSDYSKENRDSVFTALKTVSGVVQIFELQREAGKFFYKEIYTDFAGQSARFKNWALKHNLSLVNTAANETAADFVVALADNVSFGNQLGDHGGLQEWVQRILMVVYDPAGKSGSDPKELRLVDIKDLVLKTMF